MAFFGEQVLQEDGTMDRKKLSDIVFKDMEKRKKLESFTHPQIGVEFVQQGYEILRPTRMRSFRWSSRCSSR